MELYHRLVSWIIKKRIHQIDFFKKYPVEVQEEWFFRLIRQAENTVWGKFYDYKSIKNMDQYKKQVPVQTYESLMPYIQRIIQGEQNVLWPSEIKWFAKSSGTTSGKSKYIPVSKEALEDCHYKGGKDLLSIYFHAHPQSKIFNGKSLVVGGSSQINEYNPNTYYGDLSAIIIDNLPAWVYIVQTPDKSIALHPDWEEKIDKMVEITSKENVTNLSGVPSWNLILLRKVLEYTGKSTIPEVWPNLEVYAHGGVNFDAYREQYKALIPSSKMTYIETYNASEGFFGIQDQFSHHGEMLLMLDYGIFYEFMPMEEVNNENPKTIQLPEVETGKNYALIISTNAGLWRYQIGDTIQFTSLNPYRIKVSGRIKYYINVFGEELIEDNANQALKKACAQCNALISEYTVAPIFANKNGQGGHEWVIEFRKAPDQIDYFCDVLDNALKSLNSDYEAKRYKDIVLQQPVLHVAGSGTFYKWLKKNKKIGGQHKVPRLSNDRKHIEQLLSMLT